MPGLGNSSGGGGSGAIRAGRAFVELFLEDNKVLRSLDKLKKRFDKVGKFLVKTGGAFAAAGTAITAPIGAIFKSSIDRASKIGDLAGIFGGTTEEVSKMAYAFETAGYSLDELEASMSRLAKTDTSGRPLDEVFADTVDTLNEMGPSQERNAIAAELFGKSYSKILDIGQDLRRLMKEAPLVSKADADRAEEFNQSFASLAVHAKVALLPFLQQVTPAVTGMTDFLKANVGVLRTVALVGVGLTTAGVVLITLGLGFTAASIAIGAVTTVLSTLAGIVGALFTPMGLFVAAVAGLGYLFLTQTESGTTFISELKTGFAELAETAKTSFEGISDAISAGEWGLALKIALTGMQLEWAKTVAFWTDVWNKFKGIFVDGWSAAVTSIALLLNDMSHGAQSVFESLAAAVGNAFAFIADKALSAAITVAEALDKLDPTDSLKDVIAAAHAARTLVNADARAGARDESAIRQAAIEKERLAIEKELMQAHSREQKAREKARANDLASAQADIVRLNAELARLRGQAGSALLQSTIGDIAGAIAGGVAGVKGPSSGKLNGGEVRSGLASAFGQQQFGFGSTIEKKNLLANQMTAKHTAETAKNVLGLVNALMFR